MMPDENGPYPLTGKSKNFADGTGLGGGGVLALVTLTYGLAHSAEMSTEAGAVYLPVLLVGKNKMPLLAICPLVVGCGGDSFEH